MDVASESETELSLNTVVLVELESFLKIKIANDDFSYKICRATKKGENYIGVVYRIKVEFRKNSSAYARNCFSLIVKVPPDNQIQRKQFFARPCFLRESLAYEEFLPLVAKFQEEKGLIDDDEKFTEYSEVYRCLKDEMNEAIIMEDLSSRNYRLFDRFKELDFEHVAFVMRIYAKLHAVSFAIQDQSPSRILPFTRIIDIFVQRREDGQLAAYFEHLKESALKSLNIQTDEKYYGILKKYFTKHTFFDLLLSVINEVNQCPKEKHYAVVCHGDCWNNNILFKYDERGNVVVVDAKLIDWQLMRFASPITDVMYYLFTCTTGKFRKQHFKSILNLYYKELSLHMQRLESNCDKVFPREIFETEVLNKGVSGLLFAMIVLPIATLKSEDSPDLVELSKRIEAGYTTDLKGAGFLGNNNSDSYEQRMRDVIIDCIDFGYIKN